MVNSSATLPFYWNVLSGVVMFQNTGSLEYIEWAKEPFERATNDYIPSNKTRNQESIRT